MGFNSRELLFGDVFEEMFGVILVDNLEFLGQISFVFLDGINVFGVIVFGEMERVKDLNRMKENYVRR